MSMKLYLMDTSPAMVKVYPSHEYQVTEMRKLMTVRFPGARHTPAFKHKKWDGNICYFDGKAMMFPIGFLSQVRAMFPDATLHDRRSFADIPFRVPQLDGLELRMYQKEAILWAFEHRNGIVQAATNSGKSAIMAGLVSLLQEEKILLLIHREEILWQLRGMIAMMTKVPIGYISAEETLVTKNVNIAMVTTMLHRLRNEDPVVTEVYKRSKVLMVDEAHHMQAKTYQVLLMESPAIYRFGFSGTIPPEHTYEGVLCRNYVGDVVFNITNKELIEAGVSAKPIIMMYNYEHDINYPQVIAETRERVNAAMLAKNKKFRSIKDELERVYSEVFRVIQREHVVENVARSGVVVSMVRESFPDKQALIVVDYLEHGQIIKDMFIHAGTPASDVEYIHGSSENRKLALEDFRAGRLRVLIATSIVDEGIDISRISLLVLAGGKKSKRQILQRIGRGLRRKETDNVVYVFDFYDIDDKYLDQSHGEKVGYLEKHSKERLKIYIDEGFEINVVNPGQYAGGLGSELRKPKGTRSSGKKAAFF